MIFRFTLTVNSSWLTRVVGGFLISYLTSNWTSCQKSIQKLRACKKTDASFFLCLFSYFCCTSISSMVLIVKILIMVWLVGGGKIEIVSLLTYAALQPRRHEHSWRCYCWPYIGWVISWYFSTWHKRIRLRYNVVWDDLMCYVYDSKWVIFGLNLTVKSSQLTHWYLAIELVIGGSNGPTLHVTFGGLSVSRLCHTHKEARAK